MIQIRMKICYKRYFVAVAAALLSVVALQAGRPSLKAKLDSATMLMGNINMMRVEVVQDEGVHGGFPLLELARQTGIAGVCGDSVELRPPVKVDTVRLGSGRIQLNFDIPVQSFDSGYYKLPGLVYVCGRDSVVGNLLTLKVNPVKGVTAQSEISPYTDVLGPDNPSVWDHVPDWIADWWWIYVLVLVLGGAAFWYYKTRRPEETVVVLKPRNVPKPWNVALSELNVIKDRKLWESGREKEYFTDLTEVLRKYLDARFSINAMEMTSRQIMDTLRENPSARDKRDYVRQILDIADFVKFAKVRPLPDDNTRAYDNAVNFVKATELSGEEEDTFMQNYAERLAREEEERLKNGGKRKKGSRKAARKTKGKNPSAKVKKQNKKRKEKKS